MSQVMQNAETATNNKVQATERVTLEAEDEDEECFFQDIYLLAEQGISVADIEKMRAAGINTVKGLQMTTSANLLKLGAFDADKVVTIQEAAHRISVTSRFMTALEVSEERQQVFKIPTGSTNFE